MRNYILTLLDTKLDLFTGDGTLKLSLVIPEFVSTVEIDEDDVTFPHLDGSLAVLDDSLFEGLHGDLVDILNAQGLTDFMVYPSGDYILREAEE